MVDKLLFPWVVPGGMLFLFNIQNYFVLVNCKEIPCLFSFDQLNFLFDCEKSLYLSELFVKR